MHGEQLRQPLLGGDHVAAEVGQPPLQSRLQPFGGVLRRRPHQKQPTTTGRGIQLQKMLVAHQHVPLKEAVLQQGHDLQPYRAPLFVLDHQRRTHTLPEVQAVQGRVLVQDDRDRLHARRCGGWIGRWERLPQQLPGIVRGGRLSGPVKIGRNARGQAQDPRLASSVEIQTAGVLAAVDTHANRLGFAQQPGGRKVHPQFLPTGRAGEIVVNRRGGLGQQVVSAAGGVGFVQPKGADRDN